MDCAAGREEAVMTHRAFFVSCGECGKSCRTIKGLCPDCVPLYPDFTDDVDPASRPFLRPRLVEEIRDEQ